MRYHILASGSKGNATVLVFDGVTLLIDQGLSLTEYKKRLNVVGVNDQSIDAVLYTHRHTDHVQPHFNKLAGDNVYAPSQTLPEGATYTLVTPYYPFNIKGLNVMPLPISHDTPTGVGYVISDGKYKVVYMTDTGYISTKNLAYMENADLYIIEANHSPSLLLKTNRPFDLIQRILSDTGHLSNEHTAHYLAEIIGPATKAIILAHLSEEANTPETALATIDQVFRKFGVDQTRIKIFVAPQHIPLSGALDEN